MLADRVEGLAKSQVAGNDVVWKTLDDLELLGVGVAEFGVRVCVFGLKCGAKSGPMDCGLRYKPSANRRRINEVKQRPKERRKLFSEYRVSIRYEHKINISFKRQ